MYYSQYTLFNIHTNVSSQTSANRRIKRFRLDNGGEYDNVEMKTFCIDQGIYMEFTVPYTPEQCGVAERLNKTCVERGRAMLIQAKLDKTYWAEAVNTAIYLKNRSPTVALDNKLPLKVWTGEKVDVSNIRVFGCKVMFKIPDEKRKKFDPKSQEMIMVGYCEGSKGYRLADPNQPGHVIVSRNIIFIEKRLGCVPDGSGVVPEFNELTPEWKIEIPRNNVHENVARTNKERYNRKHQHLSY